MSYWLGKNDKYLNKRDEHVIDVNKITLIELTNSDSNEENN